MGTSQSKLQAPSSLDELSVDEIRSFVTGLGAKYKVYGDAISANAVDGEVLASLDVENDAEAVKETMECLEITNFLHQRVLLKEWKKARAAMTEGGTKGQTELSRSETSYTTVTDASDITTETSELTADPSSVGNSSRRGTHDGPPQSISLKQRQLMEAFELPKSIDILPADSKELEPFRQIALQAFGDLKGHIAQVNLIPLTGECGVNNLNTILPLPNGEGNFSSRQHFDDPDNYQVCRPFILGSDEDFIVMDIPSEVSEGIGMVEPATYYGQVVKFGDLRVGTVCVIVQESKAKQTTLEEKETLLKFLAKETERHLDRRKVLLQRNHNLKYDIDQLKMAPKEDAILVAAHAPLKAVLASQVAARQNFFPYPEDLGQGPNNDNGYPTSCEFSRRSNDLSFCREGKQANGAERAHLGPAYYDAFEQGFPIDKTPVGKHDMERVACLHSLGLLEIDPLSEEAKSIQSLVDMTGTLLGADFVFLNILDHQHRNLLFPTFPKGEAKVSSKSLMFFEQTHQAIKRNANGSPFFMRSDRCTSICNYAVMSPDQRAFVVHDTAKDQSLHLWKSLVDIGFYSGAPIVIRGHAIGALCCMSNNKRPDFGKAQEVQQEQFAQLIAQQFESWALTREMRQLERERSLLLCNSSLQIGHDQHSACSMKPTKANQPEDHAALIFTDVQGADALWEAGSDAMNKALAIHNRIIRTKIAENGGYEVSTEGGAFHVAFADVVDAVNFCLQSQEALYTAPWGDDILALPDACEDASGCCRGLRVRMAVHCGDVDSTRNQLSGRVEYGGETFHVAKSLERMSHGGQILVTSDVWNIASHLVESTLRSPQVIDLGSHVMNTHSIQMHDGITSKSILQLLPASMSHDYLLSRRLLSDGEENVSVTDQTSQVQGRTFPPVMTKKSLSASFHDAPFTGNAVAMVFVDISEAEKMVSDPSVLVSELLVSDPSVLLAALSKRLSAILAEDKQRGYQCKDFMFAFAEMSEAVRFGLAVQASLQQEEVLDLCLQNSVKIGVQEGNFETMGPNPCTGRAQYFGGVVNRVARVAEAAAPGTVCLGKEATELDGFNLQPVSNGFMLDFVGRKSLKGVKEEIALYKCHPCKSWYDQMVDNRSGRNGLGAPWWRSY